MVSPVPEGEGATAASTSQPSSVPGRLAIDLLAIAEPSGLLLERWRDLSAHGYGIGPARSSEQGWSDLSNRHLGIEVAEFRLSWGIDSGAHLVVVEGAADGIASARIEIEPMADLMVAGDQWVAGLSRRVQAEVWELEDLADVLRAIREPGGACAGSDTRRLCPLGPEVGPSVPPPQLILEGPQTFGELSVEVRFLGREAEGLRGAGGRNSVSWVGEGQAMLEFTVTDPQVRGSQVLAANSLGGTLVAIELVAIDEATSNEDIHDGRIALYEPNGFGHNVGGVPVGWVLDGLALTARNTATSSEYEVIVVGKDEGGRPIAVAVDVDEAMRGNAQDSVPRLDALPSIDLGIDLAWMLPQWTPAGVTVVAERADGWYLVDDVRGERADLLRSSHPIVGYAVDQSARHVVLAVDGPTGIVNYWVSDDQIFELASTSRSMAWFGSH